MRLEKVVSFAISSGVTLFSLGASLPATAAVLANYQFLSSEPPGSPSIVSPDLTASFITASNTLDAATVGGGLLTIQPGAGASTAALAVSGNRSFQFSVTPKANFEIDLTSLTFGATRGGASTPRGWVLRSSLDGFAANIATNTIPTQTPTITPFSIDLSGTSFQNLTSSVTFRIYSFTPATGQLINYTNLILNGTTTLIPEPSSTLGLISLAAIGGGALVKRRIGK